MHSWVSTLTADAYVCLFTYVGIYVYVLYAHIKKHFVDKCSRRICIKCNEEVSISVKQQLIIKSIAAAWRIGYYMDVCIYVELFFCFGVHKI